MLNCYEITCKIISLAENIRAKLRYDVTAQNINLSQFWKMKFDKDRIDQLTICNTLYMHKNAS